MSLPLAPLMRSTAATSGALKPSRIAAASALMPLASASSVRSADSISSGRSPNTFGLAIVPAAPPARPLARIASPGDRPLRGGQPGVNHNRFTTVNQRPSADSAPCATAAPARGFRGLRAGSRRARCAKRDRLRMAYLRSSRLAGFAGAVAVLSVLIGGAALAQKVDPLEPPEGLRASIDDN